MQDRGWSWTAEISQLGQYVSPRLTLHAAYAAAPSDLQYLWHTFASRALALGESLPMIGKLLGHRQVQTTARYAHLGRNSVKTAAARIADSLAADMDMPPDSAVTT